MVSTNLCIKYTDFDPSKFDILELKGGNYLKTNKTGSKIFITRYNEKKMINIQTPWFSIDTYGLPKKDTEIRRDHLRIPLYQTDDSVKEFSNKLREIDAYLNSEKTLDLIMSSLNESNPKPVKSLKYYPLFKQPEHSENENYNIPSIKATFLTDRETKDISMRVFEYDAKNDKRIGPISDDIINDIDELNKLIGYRKKIKCHITIFKVWVVKISGTWSYGASIRIEKVEYLKDHDILDPDTKNRYLNSSEGFIDDHKVDNFNIASDSDHNVTDMSEKEDQNVTKISNDSGHKDTISPDLGDEVEKNDSDPKVKNDSDFKEEKKSKLVEEKPKSKAKAKSKERKPDNDESE